MKEKEIREYLAQNLHLISNELILVKTEYKLENHVGTNGSIDILAKDIYNNYVIIELKNSRQSSREAIHELTKYSALLKCKLRLKNSEIRLILISTDWSELKVPFYEWKSKIDNLAEGYLFTEDRQCVFIDEKLEEPEIRELSRNELMFLYQTKEKMERYEQHLIEKIKACGIKDFILLKISNDSNSWVVYPFALVLIMQRKTEDYYVSLLTSRGWKKQELDVYGYRGEEQLVFLEECLYKELVTLKMYEDVEISYPEKLASAFTQQGWKLVEIIKCGYFKEEHRDDSWYLKKILGVEEDNNFTFSDFCELKFKKRFQEMLEHMREFLRNKDDMLPVFEEIWSSICKDTVKSMSVDIYNRGDILLNLMLFEKNKDMGELPYMDLLFTFQDGRVERYILLPAYSEKELKPNHYVLKTLLSGDGTPYMIKLHTGEMINCNAEIMKNLGLTYDYFKYCYDGEEWKLAKDFCKNDFTIFYKQHKSEVQILSNWFMEHVFPN